jgi:hypothetical protein
MPAFLANDILRIWRTFCVNYEARTQTDPPAKKAKRKLKNYKLKHSRMLTCFSALAHLLAVFEKQGTVSPADAHDMVRLTPVERLEGIRSGSRSRSVKSCVDELLGRYERFLENTEASEDELIQRFLRPEVIKQLFAEAYQFGDEMFALIDTIGRSEAGKPSRFYRLLVV